MDRHMRCLYCGKELALFKRLTGGAEFCSDAHRQQYQEEYNQLALSRLLQASPVPDGPSKSVQLQAQEVLGSSSGPSPTAGLSHTGRGLGVLIDPDVPSHMGTQDWPIPANPAPANHEVHRTGGPPATPPPLKSSPEHKGSNGHIYSMGPATPREPDPPKAAGFLVKRPAPTSGVNNLASSGADGGELSWTGQPSRPGSDLRLFHNPAPSMAAPVSMNAAVAIQEHRVKQEPTGALEEPVMVRPVPDLISNTPLTETANLEPSIRVMEVQFTPNPPEQTTSLWMEDCSVFASVSPELGDLTRLAFATAGWEEIARKEGIELPERPPSVDLAVEVLPAEAEDPSQKVPESSEVADPAPQTPMLEASGPVAIAEEAAIADQPPAITDEPPAAAPIPVRSLKASPLSTRIDTLRAERRQGPLPLEISPAATRVPAVEAPAPAGVEQPIPGVVTRPLPLTLHGHAPGRAKPIQVFPSALARAAGIQVPRSTSLPLRPTIVFGAAPVKESPVVEVKSEPKTEPKIENRATETRPAEVRPTFRPLPKQAESKTPAKAPEARPISRPVVARVVPPDPEGKAAVVKAKPDEAPRPEVKAAPLKEEAPPAAVKPQASVAKPAEPLARVVEPQVVKPPEPAVVKAEPAVAKAEPAVVKAEPAVVKAEPALAKAEPAVVKPEPVFVKPEPANPKGKLPERDSKPEPPLAFDPLFKESPAPPKAAPAPLVAPYPDMDPDVPFLPVESPGFWGRLPVAAKASMAAAILVLIIAGGLYINRNSSAAAPHGPVVVAAGTVLSSGDAGWLTDWAPDPPASKRQRRIDVMRASQSLSDYRVEIEGEIERKALGWVYRASNPKNFYVSKVEVVKPGLEPTIQIARFAVIDGVEQPRQEVPINLKVRPDTLYKIRFEAMGDRFTTWILDQKVDEWTDSRITSGGVGLYREADESVSLKGGVNVIPLVVKR